MTGLKTIRPSESYLFVLPDNVCEEYDGGVSSFWLNGSPLLLQLSSYLRNEGTQVGARERLRQRMAKHAERWTIWNEKICPEMLTDEATGDFLDDKGVLWIHTYLVWPHLAIYATISGPPNEVLNPNNWARQALRSIRFINK